MTVKQWQYDGLCHHKQISHAHSLWSLSDNITSLTFILTVNILGEQVILLFCHTIFYFFVLNIHWRVKNDGWDVADREVTSYSLEYLLIHGIIHFKNFLKQNTKRWRQNMVLWLVSIKFSIKVWNVLVFFCEILGSSQSTMAEYFFPERIPKWFQLQFYAKLVNCLLFTM